MNIDRHFAHLDAGLRLLKWLGAVAITLTLSLITLALLVLWRLP